VPDFIGRDIQIREGRLRIAADGDDGARIERLQQPKGELKETPIRRRTLPRGNGRYLRI
jgi:hypothetical protein